MNDRRNTIYVSVDCTDVRIQEPKPFHAKWYSQKFRGPGIRYELGISVIGGQIVWVNGPFPAGEFSDQRIFNLNMKNNLGGHGKALADAGYAGPRVVHGSILNDLDGQRAGRLRARHEQINGGLKSFSCLKNRWRHGLHKHSTCFFAVATVVQVQLESSSWNINEQEV